MLIWYRSPDNDSREPDDKRQPAFDFIGNTRSEMIRTEPRQTDQKSKKNMPFQQCHSGLSPEGIFLFKPKAGPAYESTDNDPGQQQDRGNGPFFTICFQCCLQTFPEAVKNNSAENKTYSGSNDNQRQSALIENLPVKYSGRMEKQIRCPKENNSAKYDCQQKQRYTKTGL